MGVIQLPRRSKSSPKPSRKTTPPKTRAATIQKQKRRRRPYTLSKESLYVIRIDTEWFFWDFASKRLSNISEKWRSQVDKTLIPWWEAERVKIDAAFEVRRKNARPLPSVPPLHVSFSEIQRFAGLYRSVVNFSAGHLVNLLAQAMASRQGLGQRQQQWIRIQVEEFAREKFSFEIVQGWIGVAISTPPEAERLPDFEALCIQIFAYLDKVSPLGEATHKLNLSVALMGEEKARLVRAIPRGVLTLEDLQKQKKKSCSQVEAASVLHCSDRTIRTFISDEKLNATESGRVVVDEKFTSLSRLTHSAAKK